MSGLVCQLVGKVGVEPTLPFGESFTAICVYRLYALLVEDDKSSKFTKLKSFFTTSPCLSSAKPMILFPPVSFPRSVSVVASHQIIPSFRKQSLASFGSDLNAEFISVVTSMPVFLCGFRASVICHFVSPMTGVIAVMG